MRRPLARPIVITMVVALLSVACGSDSAPPPAAEPTDSTDSTDSTEPAADSPAPDTEDVAGDSDDEPELLASDRGITPETITLGLAVADVSAFSNTGDVVSRYQAVVDAINDNGGVIGRQIVLQVKEWDLLDNTGLDAACVALTQDVEVFAVVLRVPENFGEITCFTALNNTITVNGLDLDQAQIDDSDGLLFSTNPDRFTGLITGLRELAPELAGARVALSGTSAGGGEAKLDITAALLDELGIDVVETTLSTVSFADDPAESVAQQLIFAEAWTAAGATHVIGVDQAAVGATVALIDSGHNDEIVLVTPTVGLRGLRALGADLSQLEMIGLAAPTPADVAEAGDHGVPECVDTVVSATGETVILRPEDNELNVIPSIINACAAFDFITAALEAVGPNPTAEDFIALTSAGFSFEQTGSPSGSTSTTKHFTSDLPGQIYDWDGSTFTPRG